MKAEEFLFPHEKVREKQDKLIEMVVNSVKERKNMIIHAPTGLGKTSAVLSPVLKYALDNNLKVFFLTSRHTQHLIAIETLSMIKEKYGTRFVAADIIGKRGMCLQPAVEGLHSFEFAEYCKSLREGGSCEFYENSRDSNALSVQGKKVLADIKFLSPCHTEKIIERCRQSKVCPYELAINLAKDSAVIVSDYNYVFNENIRKAFFGKAGIELEKCILIIDEGHNLSDRMRDLVSERLTSITIDRAIAEAKKYNFDETIELLGGIKKVLEELSQELEPEQNIYEVLIEKNDFVSRINKINDYDKIIADLDFIADTVRLRQKRSFIGGVSKFLESWRGPDDGFTRIIGSRRIKNRPVLTLSYKCLDASIVTGPVFEKAHSTIVMSGTLKPTAMYRDLLGLEKCEEGEFENPFPEQNKLNLIIPMTTSLQSERSPAMYSEIARICAEIANTVPGHSAFYFPSYRFRDDVDNYFSKLCRKTTFRESKMTKEEKKNFLEKFTSYKEAVLLNVFSGSFGEGIDLPGVLKCVVVVGVPLNPPDLELRELLKYYEEKFGGIGKYYGYFFPAINKAVQATGRCIRSETDKGVLILLDKRYNTPFYRQCLPSDTEYTVSKNYISEIRNFFR